MIPNLTLPPLLQAEMVIFEAARAICNLRDVTTRELTPVRRGGEGGGENQGGNGMCWGGEAYNRTPPVWLMPPPILMMYLPPSRCYGS